MVVFQLHGGVSAVFRLAERARLFSFATSLGHPHSLVSCYSTASFLDSADYLTDAQKARIRDRWMGEAFVRASIGLEYADDLIADLDQALAH
jgi:cystathionine beta-lyase/cystathionine gamma-synthase